LATSGGSSAQKKWRGRVRADGLVRGLARFSSRAMKDETSIECKGPLWEGGFLLGFQAEKSLLGLPVYEREVEF
jgi:hypothetical protein